MDKEVQEKISQLSMIEQQVQQFSLQKQQFQAQLVEAESAEREIQDSKECYKIIGNIMVSRGKDDLQKELAEKKEVLTMRVESFEKQEEKLREKAEALQKEVMEAMKE